MTTRSLRSKEKVDTSQSSDTEKPPNKRKASLPACIQCRKRKSKCDRALPSCSTCLAVYGSECTYDPESDRRRKGPVNYTVRQQNNVSDTIIASLCSLPEDEAIALLRSLRNDTSPEIIAATLTSNVTSPNRFTMQVDDEEQEFSYQPPLVEQQSSSFVPDPNDSTAFSDPDHAQRGYWTAFPGQTMPMLQQAGSSMSMDLSDMGDTLPQQPMYADSGGTVAGSSSSAQAQQQYQQQQGQNPMSGQDSAGPVPPSYTWHWQGQGGY